LHPFCIFAAAVAAQQAPSGGAEPAIGAADPAIVVTAAREPIHRDEAAVSLTLFDRPQLEGLALPQAADLLRLAPGVSVSVSGPRGSQTELRSAAPRPTTPCCSSTASGSTIRPRAMHPVSSCSPATFSPGSKWCGGRNPRFGGSEALGGVVAVETPDPLREAGLRALGEYGSHDSRRAAAGYAQRLGKLGIGGTASWLASDGIDAFGAGGERDAMSNGRPASKPCSVRRRWWSSA
jgi:vitamin B12 transporter